MRQGAARLAVAVAIAALSAGLVGCTIPVVGRECEGMTGPVCEAQLAEAERSSPLGSEGIVAIQVRCTVASCTEAAGEASVTVRYADGRTSSFGTGWAMAAPAPAAPLVEPTPLPVEPVCLGVPDEWCLDMAGSVDGISPKGVPVASIVVRCTATCTSGAGHGTTVLTFRDGSQQHAEWGYSSGEPAATP
jgi:hypothetical protein